MKGGAKKIIGMLESMSEWSAEEIREAFGKRESERIIQDARCEALEGDYSAFTAQEG